MELKYNTLDLEISRPFFVRKHLSLRPIVGLRAVQIDQEITAKYISNQPPNDDIFPATSPFHSKVEMKNNFRAIGFRGGFNLGWHIHRRLSIWGKIFASANYGEFDLKFREEQTALLISFATTPPLAKDRDQWHTLKANMEGGIGLEWHTYFDHHKGQLLLSLGYEAVHWFNQNYLRAYDTTAADFENLSVFYSQEPHGDLTLQGAVLSARIDF